MQQTTQREPQDAQEGQQLFGWRSWQDAYRDEQHEDWYIVTQLVSELLAPYGMDTVQPFCIGWYNSETDRFRLPSIASKLQSSSTNSGGCERPADASATHGSDGSDGSDGRRRRHAIAEGDELGILVGASGAVFWEALAKYLGTKPHDWFDRPAAGGDADQGSGETGETGEMLESMECGGYDGSSAQTQREIAEGWDGVISEQEAGQHPVDSFTELAMRELRQKLEEKLEQRLKQKRGDRAGKGESEGERIDLSQGYVRHSHELGPRMVQFQSCAQHAGLAAYHSESWLSLHARFGPWFALRSIVVLPLRGPCSGVHGLGRTRAQAPQGQLTAEQSAQVQAMVQTLLTEPEFDWRRWLAMRDEVALMTRSSCHRYPEPLLEYHYTKDTALLRPFLAAPSIPSTLSDTIPAPPLFLDNYIQINFCCSDFFH